MRRANGPNHPPGGSTKVNGQDPTRPRKIDANLMIHADEDDASGQDDTDHHDDDWKTDNSLVFLSRFGDNHPDSSSVYLPPDYVPTCTTAFMMDDMGTIFLEDNLNSDPEASDLTAGKDPVGYKVTTAHGTATAPTVLYYDRKPFFPSPPLRLRSSSVTISTIMVLATIQYNTVA